MSSRIMNHLREGQRNINSLLSILERQLAGIRGGDKPDYRLMYDIAHYLTYYPDRYHHPCEDMIFARLSDVREDLAAVAGNIEKQHHQLAREGGMLRDLIGEIIDGSVVPREVLLSLGANYINAYRLHMHTEETKLFCELPGSLQASDWMILNSVFHWLPDPVFSEEATREYQHLRESINAEGAGEWPWSDVGTRSCYACSSA